MKITLQDEGYTNWRVMFVIALLVTVTIFIAQNFKVVEITFLIWKFQASRSLVLLATLFMGFVIGAMMRLFGK